MDNLFLFDVATQETKGPYRLAHLQALIDGGAVTPETPVSRAGDTQWTPLGAFGVLHGLKWPKAVRYGFAPRATGAISTADATRPQVEVKAMLAAAEQGGPPPARVLTPAELKAQGARPTRFGDWVSCIVWGGLVIAAIAGVTWYLGALGRLVQTFLAVLYVIWIGGTAWIVFGLSSR